MSKLGYSVNAVASHVDPEVAVPWLPHLEDMVPFLTTYPPLSLGLGTWNFSVGNSILIFSVPCWGLVQKLNPKQWPSIIFIKQSLSNHV